MNKIEGVLDRSDYNDSWDFMNFQIDGRMFDEVLDELFPDKYIKGLIPTLVEWMDREDEKSIVWNRILPMENNTTICPILMCPDDCDFSCTLVVAEIRNSGKTVEWLRIGMRNDYDWIPENVGNNVGWLQLPASFIFSIEDYKKMINVFQDRMFEDRKRAEETKSESEPEPKKQQESSNSSSISLNYWRWPLR